MDLSVRAYRPGLLNLIEYYNNTVTEIKGKIKR